MVFRYKALGDFSVSKPHYICGKKGDVFTSPTEIVHHLLHDLSKGDVVLEKRKSPFEAAVQAESLKEPYFLKERKNKFGDGDVVNEVTQVAIVEDKLEDIVTAISALDPDTDYTKAGKPRVKLIAEFVGYDVEESAVAEAFAVFNSRKKTSD